MLRLFVALGIAVSLGAAEKNFDFTTLSPGAPPGEWVPAVAGSSASGQWKVVMEDVPSAFERVSVGAPNYNRQPVLSQVGRTALDEHFPLLFYTGERLADFSMTTRLKIVDGHFEQIAGVVFRARDEKNFYVARLSALGGNLRFYKVVDGQRGQPIGRDLPIEKNRWYELTVKARANQIDILVDGTNAIPTLFDNSHSAGWVGFMTKSDSVAVFGPPRLTYTPIVSLAQVLVREVLEDQPRLLNLRLLGTSAKRQQLHVLAAKNATEVGRDADETDRKVFEENQTYFGRTKDAAIVTCPLHDRNGEVVGVMKFFLKPYAGQIESTTVARVMPTLKKLEPRINAGRDLTEE
jgi:hypothetical protein